MLRFIVLLLAAVSCFGQFDPDGAQVNLYFPHLADGGNAVQKWQTSFVFVNPHLTLPAAVFLFTFGDNGQPLNIDLGSGPLSTQFFFVPAGGSVSLRSTVASPTTIQGYATATSSLPLQATVFFRRIDNGAATVELSAPATLPSQQYFSPANRDLSIEMVNIYPIARSFQINALDSTGALAGTGTVNLGPNEHSAFGLAQKIPGLLAGFTGSIRIFPIVGSDQFLAWTLNVNGPLLSTLPPGRLSWPISHWDRIWNVYWKLLAAAPLTVANLGITGVNLNTLTAANLTISADPSINAFAQGNNIQINLAVSELISDSPSELAFIVAHELGHVAQSQHGGHLILTDPEQDADLFGTTLMFGAGFDPYAGAGALAKLSMMAGSAGLLADGFDGLNNPQSSLNTRISLMFSTMTQACALPVASANCAIYKFLVHPNFPVTAPL